MPTSWKRSREAALWQQLDPVDATRVMLGHYGEEAGAEMLLRAFLAERDMRPASVRFWLKVYDALKETQPARIADCHRKSSEGEGDS